MKQKRIREMILLTGLVLLQSSVSFAAGDKQPPPAQAGGGGNAPAPQGGSDSGSAPATTNSGGAQSGTIWDHVPEGGGIRSESDGSWTIMDKNMNPVGHVPAGQSAPTTPAGPKTDDWSPDQMRGTVWDQVPEGGSIRAEADGTWTILDRNGNSLGTYPLPATPPASEPVPPPPPAQPPLPPPLTTPLTSGGVMTSQQQADGSWTHHYHRRDSDGSVVDYDIKPTDEAFPHEDPRFWKPGQTSPDRVITRTSGGGTITSTRNADGTWTHYYESADGNVGYRLRPNDELYPRDDPRFQADPFGQKVGMGSGSDLGRDVQEGFADAGQEHHPA